MRTILKSIILENIRSYGREEIEFPEGVTLFAGDIGSGKSSILMAVEFALFGLGSQKSDALLSKGTDHGRVILDFEAGGRRYEIRRELVRKNGTVKQDTKPQFRMNGESEALSIADLKQRVLQVLKFNEPANTRAESKIFRYAVFTPQEEMKRVLESQDKLETIRKAFSIENYRYATENAKEIAKQLKVRSSILAYRFKDLDEMKRSLEDTGEEIARINARISSKTGEIEEVENEKKSLQEERESLRKRENKKRAYESDKIHLEEMRDRDRNYAQKLESEITSLKGRTDSIRRDIATLEGARPPTEMTLDGLDGAIGELHSLESERNQIETQIKRGYGRISRLERNLGEKAGLDAGELEAESQAAGERIKESNTKREAVEERIKSLSARRGGLEQEKRTANGEVEKITRLESQCYVCRNEITEEYRWKLISGTQARIAAAESGISAVRRELEEERSRAVRLKSDAGADTAHKAEIERTIPNLRQLAEERRDIAGLESNLESVRGKIAAMPTRFPGMPVGASSGTLQAIRNRLADYQRSQDRLGERRRELAEKERRIGEAEVEKAAEVEKVEESKSRITEIDENLKSFAGLDDTISECEGKIKTAYDAIVKGQKSISADRATLEASRTRESELQEKIEEAKRWKSEHKRMGNIREWVLNYFVQAVERIEKQVLLRIQQQFNEAYRTWYSMLIEDETKDTRIDEKFTPIVDQNGYELNVDFLSGGEKTAVALAYRLALNSVMRQEIDGASSNILILDEPTDGFSKDQLSKIKDVLDRLDSRQVILVSHESELETFADTVYRISKESGESKIVRE